LSNFKKLKTKVEKARIPFSFQYVRIEKFPYSIAGAIISYARENRVDLIVMGTRNLKGLKKKVFVSVSGGVVQYADCGVITVK